MDQLEKHMVGLVSYVQIGYLYQGAIEVICETDWVEQHGVEKLLKEQG